MINKTKQVLQNEKRMIIKQNLKAFIKHQIENLGENKALDLSKTPIESIMKEFIE